MNEHRYSSISLKVDIATLTAPAMYEFFSTVTTELRISSNLTGTLMSWASFMDRWTSSVTTCDAHNMRMKLTKEPVTSIAGTIATPEPLRSLSWCYASLKSIVLCLMSMTVTAADLHCSVDCVGAKPYQLFDRSSAIMLVEVTETKAPVGVLNSPTVIASYRVVKWIKEGPAPTNLLYRGNPCSTSLQEHGTYLVFVMSSRDPYELHQCTYSREFVKTRDQWMIDEIISYAENKSDDA